jgi:asparagine synthase (glutamine-hydrolysing)
MCGICGIVYSNNNRRVNHGVLDLMSQSLEHRGPDSNDSWYSDGIGFSHRRLTILDISTASNQPMVDNQTGVVISYNGEIYNYIEIREKLIDKGHVFLSTGDTEVLLRAYIEWKHELFMEINGMFAFSIYDPRDNTVFFARDFFGQKPLFYYHYEEGIIFSSELNSLIKNRTIPHDIDKEAISEYLLYDTFVQPNTPIKNVKKLEAGHAIIFNRKNNKLKKWKYHNHAVTKDRQYGNHPTKEDYIELESILKGSLKRHLRSDVPLGVYLSGGIDSTLITLLASDVLGASNIHTFSVGSTVKSYDESIIANKTASILGTQHHNIVLSPEECLSSIVPLIDGLDEPLSDPGFLAISQVAKFASEYVKVVLSGDGGDELFYGYPPFYKWNAANKLDNVPSWVHRAIFRPLIDKLPDQYGYMGLLHKLKIFYRGVGYAKEVRNSRWIGSFMPEEIANLMVIGNKLESLNREKYGVEEIYRHVINIHKNSNTGNEIQTLGYEYQQSFLPNIICNHTDKANMLFSLEARSPLLDKDLAMYANSIPVNWKVNSAKGKYILREYLGKRLGAYISNKGKQGFTVPLALWFKNELRDYCTDMLSHESLRKVGLFNIQYVHKILEDHLNGKSNNYKKIWTLIVLTNWLNNINK